MATHLRHALVLGLALGVLGACSTATISGTGNPQQQAQVVSPTTGVEVTATISAVTLGDECGSGSLAAPSTQDCAMIDAGPDATAEAKRGGCGGGSTCQQSNMQLAFTTGSGSKSSKVEIVAVTLHDAGSGAEVDSLTPSSPQVWGGSSYAAWDQNLKPASETKASYNLSAPGWAKMGSGTNTYSQKYRLHVTLRVDGAEIILQSAVLSREPQVAT
jgi:hypothetical protein